jgi:hypothetical protein
MIQLMKFLKPKSYLAMICVYLINKLQFATQIYIMNGKQLKSI